MTENWKSVGNYYCDYCKTFIRDDAFNRRNHEASDRHQNALKRQVRTLHKKHEQEQRDLARTNRELLKMGGKVAPVVKEVDKKLPKKVNVGVKAQKKEQAGVLEDAEIQRQVLAAQAMPGQWATAAVEVPLTSDVKDEVKDEAEEGDAVKGPASAPGLSSTAQALKRVREGHDDEMLGYKVAVMETKANNDAVAGPAVAFKKRAPKTRPAKPT
ncbi:hypothetical protein BCR37DRAFT_193282 [Protomyces lactucae-debilis]|uniref:Matrin-type domain-containing protein n=1 Tax=Protomyces lactucae-debilis TaxID=2754530 RepID=A0A1Y2EU53_PROLT|nr:uncharacterized protein BCR37DRAFT_193282 [Protomyces lactucae-debilis]ORY75102.1 hypothetical protein BCR37DRAFT_193282 [Protomyces lactucae-debilis]